MLCWLAQHGTAAVQLDATFVKGTDSKIGGPACWVRYDYGFNVLPRFLPNLTHLELSSSAGFMMAKHDLFSIQTLIRLQTLDLTVESNGSWHLQTLDPLHSLTALRSLRLLVEGLESTPMLLTAALSGLSLLTSLVLQSDGPRRQDSLCTYDTQTAGTVISSLVLLQQVVLAGVVDSIPDAFSSLQHLEHLGVGGDKEAWPDFVVPNSFRSCCKLTSLHLDSFAVSPERIDWLAGCSVLAGLPALSSIYIDAVNLEDIPADSWAFSNNLTYLYISFSGLQEVLKALVSLTRIQELDLRYNKLVDLPAGPYLEQLTKLHLTECNFHAVPVALARATSLKELYCRDNLPWFDADRLKALLPQHCHLRAQGSYHSLT